MNSNFQMKGAQTYIMAVEDSSVQAKKLKFLLAENGFSIQVFNNGKEALKAALDKLPTLIISDIVMPEMDGYELCSNLKADSRTKEIPVILLTSLRDPLDIIKGLQAGADNFITKPYEDNYLLSRIQYLLANRNIQKSGGAEMVMEIMFKGNRYSINSEKKQILDLLLSVYEAAIQRNDELIQTQAQLQASNEELLTANQELEAFAHTVSHDLRSPLQRVLGYADVIGEEYSDVLDKNAHEFLQKIKDAARSMAQITEDLLRFSRSARAEMEHDRVNLSDIAKNIITGFRQREPDRTVEVFIEENLVCTADPGLITIVLENLLSNAWKYSGKTQLARISFKAVPVARGIAYSVSDNGAGFDMANQHKMFNPFERFHTQQEFPGTGVGLATVRRIIERHGGKIWAEGAVGKGATFFFTLAEA